MQFFSRRWTSEDIADLKADLQDKPPDSASGWDEESYATMLKIPNEALADLFNRALYRTIGLECVLLKMLTLLMDKRVREWASARNILPDSQNGFRPQFRTNNNAFILRCAADRAREQGETLFVCSVDLTNAFPSVDRPLLWLKLQSLGMSGPLFD
ncbi:hypothetical protein AURDEDRAFT_66108, partial [Auricularia subglabra TFB-10046 SS5]